MITCSRCGKEIEESDAAIRAHQCDCDDIESLESRVNRLEERDRARRALTYAVAAAVGAVPGGSAEHINAMMTKAVESAPFDWIWMSASPFEESSGVSKRIQHFAETCAEWDG